MTVSSAFFDRHADQFIALRHQIHQHPELAFEEFKTSELVAARLAEWGYQVERGLGGTGVVGQLKRGDGRIYVSSQEGNTYVVPS